MYLMTEANPVEPPSQPPTILDLERTANGGCFDMMLKMADACPSCGSVGDMCVGDYVCWGFCYKCYGAARLAEDEAYAAYATGQKI